MLCRFLVSRESVAIRSEVHLIARARIHKNMRHHADILVIVVMHRVPSSVQNNLSVRLRLIFHHVKFGVLRVLCEVLLNRTLLACVAEREGFKVVLKTEVVVDVRRLLLELFDEPHVAVSGKEELRGDLVHIVLADHAAAHSLLQLGLDVLELVVGDEVHGQRCFTLDIVGEAVDVEEAELGHVGTGPS